MRERLRRRSGGRICSVTDAAAVAREAVETFPAVDQRRMQIRVALLAHDGECFAEGFGDSS